MTGQEIVDRWIAFIRRYVVLSDQQALAVALWAILSWTSERFAVSPYLEIVATSKRSGKTTLLDVLALLTRNAQQFATIRVLTIVRLIAALESKCTILLDETEILSRSTLGDTRQCLASGYRQGASHAINVGSRVIKFPCACLKAFAQIGNVTDVLRDRCIEIELQRGTPERILSEWRDAAEAEAMELVTELQTYSRRLERWPVVPADWLHARERELWTPLVSVAHTLGCHADTLRMLQATSVDLGLLKQQPAKTYHSAQDETDQDDREAAERVLADLASVYREGEVFLPSAEAVDRLRAVPIAPWRKWRGDGINEITLAALLSRYGIEPVQSRITATKPPRGVKPPQRRGYRLADLRKHSGGK